MATGTTTSSGCVQQRLQCIPVSAGVSIPLLHSVHDIRHGVSNNAHTRLGSPGINGGINPREMEDVEWNNAETRWEAQESMAEPTQEEEEVASESGSAHTQE